MNVFQSSLIGSLIIWSIIIFIALLLQGCGTLNPAGTVKAEYDPATGKITYESDKSLNIELIKEGENTTLRIHSDAAAGINARSQAAATNAEIIDALIKTIE